jgi:hypothetical protein
MRDKESTMSLEAEIPQPPLCFVIMPFHDPFNEYYTEIILPAGEKAGYVVQRADDIMGPGAFMQDVANRMMDATVVLAELTGRNPNVFYELGLAHAWGKPVIMLTQRKEDVPSDLLALKWISYRTISPTWAEKLAGDIVNALSAVARGDRKGLFFPFIHPSVSTSSGDLLGKLSRISGSQKQILDYIKDSGRPVDQRVIERRFSLFPAAELFYRLEYLRLQGFLISKETARDSSGKGIYSFDLTPAAREILR